MYFDIVDIFSYFLDKFKMRREWLSQKITKSTYQLINMCCLFAKNVKRDILFLYRGSCSGEVLVIASGHDMT